MLLANLIDFAGGMFADGQVVIDIDDVVVYVDFRSGKPLDFNDFIGEVLGPDFGLLSQDGRAIPEIKQEKSAGFEVAGDGLEALCQVLVSRQVAEDMKQGDDDIELLVQVEMPDIALLEYRTL